MGVSECGDLFPLSVGYEPWLMQLNARKKDMQEFMNPYDHIIIQRNIPQLKGKVCLGCFEDWLLLADRSTKSAFLLHRSLDPKLKICLPSLHGESLKCLGGCIISSSPTSRKFMVTIVGRRRDVILYCRPKIETSWTKVSLSMDMQGNHSFTGQVVRFKGKIYIFHGCTVAHRFVVINEDSLLMGCCRWTIVQMPNTIGCWNHLVVSGHDIFLVSIATSRSRGIPTNYTIHRLETSDQTWERVESIGGCVFFLGGIQSTALSATQAGTQRDCIYVVNQNYSVLRGEGVYKICLRDQTLSLSLVLKRPRDLICKLCWVMPTRSRKNSRETFNFVHSISTNKGDHATYVHKEKKKEEKCRSIDITRPWAYMPIELVQLLFPHLYLVDCLRLPSICKAWNSLSNPIKDAKVYPMLMYPVNNNSCLWKLFDPVFEKEYHIDMKWLGSSNKDLTFHYSKDGWVLASKENNSLFLINPLTREIISLPHFGNCRSTAMSFSSTPTCFDCVVFVLSFTEFHVLQISTWSPGEGEWRKISFIDVLGCYVPCSPVFTRGEFYCYRMRGELSVYNPKKKSLRTLEMKAPIEMKRFSAKIRECYLTESEGDLITVFRNRSKDPIRVFKLDQQNRVWTEVDGVGDITIFLDHRTSLAKSGLEKRCRNLIYLSGFTDDCCNSNALYSLETNKYHPEICYNLKQPINCIWIEPSLKDE